MKHYCIKLALLLLLLTLLIPSSLPTATAAPSSEAEEEYHPGINAKQLKVYQKAVKTADCGDLPPMACTPDGPNDPGDQEKLIHDRIIPGGTTVDEVTITNNPPAEHWQYEECGYPKEQWRETNYDQVDLSLGYPPEYSEQPDTIRGYKQGFKDRITITGPWILPPYHHPDCEKALHGTAIEETNLSGRYTLTDAPHSDSDDIADAYDACPSEPGPASNDGCPRSNNSLNITEEVEVRLLDPIPIGPEIRILHTQFRLLLSEGDQQQPQLRINADAMTVQPNADYGWTEERDSRQVGCNDYVENGIRRSECTVSVTISNEGEWAMELSGGSSDGIRLGISFDQGTTYATFNWTFRTQLSERDGVPGYSIYQVGKGSDPIFLPGN